MAEDEALEKALTQAEETAVELARQGKVEEALRCVFGSVREALLPLAKRSAELQKRMSELTENVDRLTADVAELRGAVREQGRQIEQLTADVAGLYGVVERRGEQIERLTADIRGLREIAEKHGEHIGHLTASIGELREIVEKQGEQIERLMKGLDELRVRVDELTANLEKEVELRRGLEGRVGRVEGRIIEFGLGERLARWCDHHGLKFGALPPEPFRVDGVVEGERLIALVQIAKTGSEEDVEQLLEGARIYEERMGERPNALVLYVYAGRPSGELVRLCERHGIIVDNSPRRIAKQLVKLDEELGRGGA